MLTLKIAALVALTYGLMVLMFFIWYIAHYVAIKLSMSKVTLLPVMRQEEVSS